jgi:hypothetical protein
VPTFICEEIAVRCDGIPAQPVSFTWRGKEYRVVSVERSWHDWGFAQAAPKKDWRSRHHRNYYHLQTEDGSAFEIYLDRGHRAKPVWILHKIVSE